MARKLSEKELKAYNDLVDAGRHLDARRYLADAISPGFMIIAKRETPTTEQATASPGAKSPRPKTPLKEGTSAAPAGEVKAQPAQTGPVRPRNFWERLVPKSKPELSETSADPSPVVTSSPVQPDKPKKVERRHKASEVKKPIEYKPKSCRPCFKNLTRRPRQK